MTWFEDHAARLRAADDACRRRVAYSPFVESPKRTLHRAGAKDAGRAAFERCLGTTMQDTGPGGPLVGREVSPYTAEPLRVRYEQPGVDAVFTALSRAWPAWRDASPTERVGVCLEALDRLAAVVFENTFATMHTTGQGFLTAFAGSGANSLDRGLEALVYAKRAMADAVAEADFERRFGDQSVRMRKRYRLRGRGPAVVISCGSYPAWNAYPAIFANLATGNPVVIKPHPATVLPMARVAQILRQTLRDAGHDPDLLILAPDEADAPLTDTLVRHDATAIVDFTGSQAYGEHLERTARGLVYTETAGCNAVIVESAEDLDAVLASVAHGVCLFSGQMCTTPQNIFVPAKVATDDGVWDFARVRDRLVESIDALVARPEVAAGVCGAIHNPDTLARIEALAARPGDGATVVRAPQPYAHPEFANARTMTPVVVQVDPAVSAIHRMEHFGPVAFVIAVRDREEALARATDDARTHGAIASYAYSTDAAYRQRVEEAFFAAGASIGFNLVEHRPINYTAAFSDYHVTGLNPAGNACLTDLAFVASRFRIVQSKTELPR